MEMRRMRPKEAPGNQSAENRAKLRKLGLVISLYLFIFNFFLTTV